MSSIEFVDAGSNVTISFLGSCDGSISFVSCGDPMVAVTQPEPWLYASWSLSRVSLVFGLTGASDTTSSGGSSGSNAGGDADLDDGGVDDTGGDDGGDTGDHGTGSDAGGDIGAGDTSDGGGLDIDTSVRQFGMSFSGGINFGGAGIVGSPGPR